MIMSDSTTRADATAEALHLDDFTIPELQYWPAFEFGFQFSEFLLGFFIVCL